MKIGVIGPQKSVDLIVGFSYGLQPGVEFVPLPTLIDDLTDNLDRWQKSFDGLFFTGFIPYSRSCTIITPSVPWDYFSKANYSILMTLFEAVLDNGSRLSSISYDLQEDVDAKFLGRFLGNIDASKCRVYCFEPSEADLAHDVEYSDHAAEFHIENIRSGKAGFCLTGSDTVRAKVEAAGCKAYWVEPFESEIKIQLTEFIQRCMIADKNSESGSVPAVISVITTLNNGINYSEQSDFALSRNANRTIHSIYTFSQLIGGAVEAHANGASFIYYRDEKSDLTAENTLILRLFKMLRASGTDQNIFLGLGTHKSVGQAKDNSLKALRIASLQQVPSYCMVYENSGVQSIVGPFTFDRTEDRDAGDEGSFSRSDEISRDTGISARSIQRISDIARQYALDMTTLSDLSSLTGIGKSNLNRILTRLEEYGYVENAGIQPLSGAGRPRKLIRIKF